MSIQRINKGLGKDGVAASQDRWAQQGVSPDPLPKVKKADSTGRPTAVALAGIEREEPKGINRAYDLALHLNDHQNRQHEIDIINRHLKGKKVKARVQGDSQHIFANWTVGTLKEAVFEDYSDSVALRFEEVEASPPNLAKSRSNDSKLKIQVQELDDFVPERVDRTHELDLTALDDFGPGAAKSDEIAALEQALAGKVVRAEILDQNGDIARAPSQGQFREFHIGKTPAIFDTPKAQAITVSFVDPNHVRSVDISKNRLGDSDLKLLIKEILPKGHYKLNLQSDNQAIVRLDRLLKGKRAKVSIVDNSIYDYEHEHREGTVVEVVETTDYTARPPTKGIEVRFDEPYPAMVLTTANEEHEDYALTIEELKD